MQTLERESGDDKGGRARLGTCEPASLHITSGVTGGPSRT